MEKPWEIVSKVLKYLASYTEAGMTTAQLDKIAEGMVLEMGGTPYNKGYHPKWAETPFPASLCTSINEEICHGIPSERILKDGDLISFDLGVKKDGLCGDAALTIGVGNIRTRDKKLLDAAKATLYSGIRQVRAGAKIKDIAQAMDSVAQIHKFKTNMTFLGHGISQEMHELPELPAHWNGRNDEGDTLKEGQVICLEPMISKSPDRRGVRLSDGWTWRTLSGDNSAFFEHQLLITKEGCQILTDHITE